MKLLVNRPFPVGAKSPIFGRYSLVAWYSASAMTPGEKSLIKTNIKSTTRFPMNLRWSSYVIHKRSKTQNSRFPGKIAIRLKKV